MGNIVYLGDGFLVLKRGTRLEGPTPSLLTLLLSHRPLSHPYRRSPFTQQLPNVLFRRMQVQLITEGDK